MADSRKAIHAFLTPESHEAWHEFAAEHGVSVSGLIEAIALDWSDRKVGDDFELAEVDALLAPGPPHRRRSPASIPSLNRPGPASEAVRTARARSGYRVRHASNSTQLHPQAQPGSVVHRLDPRPGGQGSGRARHRARSLPGRRPLGRLRRDARTRAAMTAGPPCGPRSSRPTSSCWPPPSGWATRAAWPRWCSSGSTPSSASRTIAAGSSAAAGWPSSRSSATRTAPTSSARSCSRASTTSGSPSRPRA